MLLKGMREDKCSGLLLVAEEGGEDLLLGACRSDEERREDALGPTEEEGDLATAAYEKGKQCNTLAQSPPLNL